jgi:lipopolysaccharide export system permease protein
MTRLTAYLVKLFTSNALSFFVVALVLVWLTQTLRMFDLISAKGQDMLTLMGQSVLTTPPLIVIFFYVCWGIGLTRSLRALQASQELHAIHSGARLKALSHAVIIFSLLGALFVLALTNYVEPGSNRKLNEWSASIAADLVGRTLTPNRFTQVAPGVVIIIGGRLETGEISDFFADDRRDPETRRTYVAKSAVLSKDDEGYALQLRNGSLQYAPVSGRFSEVSFTTYEIALDRLTDPIDSRNGLSETNTFQLIQDYNANGTWTDESIKHIAERFAEGLRVFAICMLVFALAGFPHARRARFEFPLEIGVLMIAFAERGVTTYVPGPPYLTPFVGAALVLVIALVIFANRRYGHLLAFGREAAA